MTTQSNSTVSTNTTPTTTVHPIRSAKVTNVVRIDPKPTDVWQSFYSVSLSDGARIRVSLTLMEGIMKTVAKHPLLAKLVLSPEMLSGKTVTGCWSALTEGQQIILDDNSSLVTNGVNGSAVTVIRNGKEVSVKQGQKCKVGDIQVIGASDRVRVNFITSEQRGGMFPTFSVDETVLIKTAMEEVREDFRTMALSNGNIDNPSKQSAVDELLKKETQGANS